MNDKGAIKAIGLATDAYLLAHDDDDAVFRVLAALFCCIEGIFKNMENATREAGGDPKDYREAMIDIYRTRANELAMEISEEKLDIN